MYLVTVILSALLYSHALTLDAVKSKFNEDGCIEGYLTFIGNEVALRTNILHSKLTMKEKDVLGSVTDHMPVEDETDENPLTLINKLAQQNGLHYHYFLFSEEGLPHLKVFKVGLKLGDEEYFGEGASIKIGRYVVADEALSKTKYVLRPAKSKTEITSLTPTVQLNNLATKLGMKVTYILQNEFVEHNKLYDSINSKVRVPEIRSSKSYTARLNSSIHNPYTVNKYTKIVNGNKSGQHSFTVVVQVGNDEFVGVGYTIQAARHDAAANALKVLMKNSENEVQSCLAKGETCNRGNIKSPISLVYETASRRMLSVEFGVVGESGPSHEKVFETRCRVGNLIVEAEGKSKKVSKKKCAEKMLKQMEDVEPVESKNIERLKSDWANKKKMKRKKKNVIKGGFNKFTRDAQDFFHSAWEYFVPDDQTKSTVLHQKDNSDSSDKSTKSRNNFKETLLDLTQKKGIPIQFYDLFLKDSNYFTLLSLDIHPPNICLGDGTSFELAREKASSEALKLFHKFGIDNIVIGKESYDEQYNNFEFIEFSKDTFLEEETE